METCLFNRTQARLLAKLLENNLRCRPKRLMNCFSQIKITCASVYLLLSLFLALVCLAFWTPIARVMKETMQRVTWNRGKSIKFPPPTPPIWCQIPHPNNNHWCQIPAPLGTSTSQMPGVCPGGGCWCLYNVFDRYITQQCTWHTFYFFKNVTCLNLFKFEVR